MSSNQNHSISRPQFFNSKGNGEQLTLSGTSGEDALHVSAGNANIAGNVSVTGTLLNRKNVVLLVDKAAAATLVSPTVAQSGTTFLIPALSTGSQPILLPALTASMAGVHYKFIAVGTVTKLCAITSAGSDKVNGKYCSGKDAQNAAIFTPAASAATIDFKTTATIGDTIDIMCTGIPGNTAWMFETNGCNVASFVHS